MILYHEIKEKPSLVLYLLLVRKSSNSNHRLSLSMQEHPNLAVGNSSGMQSYTSDKSIKICPTKSSLSDFFTKAGVIWKMHVAYC